MSNRYKMYTFGDNVKIVKGAPLYDQFNRKVDLVMNRLDLMTSEKYLFEREYCKEEGWQEKIYRSLDENQVTCVLGEAGSGKTEVCMDYLATKAEERPIYIFTQTNRQAGVCRRKFKKARERLGLPYNDNLVEIKNNFMLGGNVRKFLYHEIPSNAIVLVDEAGYIDYDSGAGRAVENTIKRGIKTIICGDLTQAGISSWYTILCSLVYNKREFFMNAGGAVIDYMMYDDDHIYKNANWEELINYFIVSGNFPYALVLKTSKNPMYRYFYDNGFASQILTTVPMNANTRYICSNENVLNYLASYLNETNYNAKKKVFPEDRCWKVGRRFHFFSR